MTTSFLLTSPLEQFEILPLLNFSFGVVDLSITNQTVILALIIFFLVLVYFLGF